MRCRTFDAGRAAGVVVRDAASQAITIGGEHAHCGTFVEISFRAGLDRVGVVGACHRSECVHNEALECTAAAVQVGSAADAADCLTYSAR